MSEYRQIIEPGPCPPGGCPPPTEIDCIKVKKVYQECAEIESREVTAIFPVAFTCNVIPDPADIVDVRCIGLTESTLHFENQCTMNNGTVTFDGGTVDKTITVQFLDSFGTVIGTCKATVTVPITETPKTIRLSRAGEPGLSCEVDVYENCLAALWDSVASTVTFCISELMVFKLYAEVQILVPTYGFCPEPAECEQVLGECPTPTINWPPYPPQLLGTTARKEKEDGCGCG